MPTLSCAVASGAAFLTSLPFKKPFRLLVNQLPLSVERLEGSRSEASPGFSLLRLQDVWGRAGTGCGCRAARSLPAEGQASGTWSCVGDSE